MTTTMSESVPGRLSGKIAVITGGAYGIGRASVLLFAREGAKVAIVDVDAGGGTETERLVREAGGEALFVQADVGRREDAEQAIAEAIARYGGVDILFNNAGIMPEGTALTHSEADWDRVMDVNLKAIFLLSRVAIPSMIARGGGSIVNTASVQGLRGHQNRLAYATSKHGVIGITRALAADFARDGVRVNAICPGTIDTPMLHRVLADLPDRDAALAEFAALHPLGVIGQPDDVAYAALYLASDESRFVTGIALPVDGGYTSLITHV
ncbi:MAG: SDR family NAD(P)-dependent oxidoreductase [Thermomicrobiales bacterium]